MKLHFSKRTAWVIFAVLVLLLLAGTTMPSEMKADIESQMWRKVPWSALAHYTLFGLIALCPVYGSGRASVWKIVLTAVTLAALTEWLQSFVPGRYPRLRDVWINLGGTTTALVLQTLLGRHRKSEV